MALLLTSTVARAVPALLRSRVKAPPHPLHRAADRTDESLTRVRKPEMHARKWINDPSEGRLYLTRGELRAAHVFEITTTLRESARIGMDTLHIRLRPLRGKSAARRRPGRSTASSALAAAAVVARLRFFLRAGCLA